MGDFCRELIELCGPSNTKSRGTYIAIAAILVLLPIAAISGVVAEVVYCIAGNFYALPLVIAVICAAIEAGMIVMLKRMD